VSFRLFDKHIKLERCFLYHLLFLVYQSFMIFKSFESYRLEINTHNGIVLTYLLKKKISISFHFPFGSTFFLL